MQDSSTSAIHSFFRLFSKRENGSFATSASDFQPVATAERPVRMERQKRLQKGSLILLSHPYLPGPAAYRVTDIDAPSRLVKFRDEKNSDSREYYAYMHREDDMLEGDIRIYRSYAVSSNQFRSTERRKVIGTYSPQSGLPIL